MDVPQLTRRTALAAIGGMALSSGAAAQAEKYPRNLTKDDLDRFMAGLSNWGRWGKDDQAGTINLITPAKRKAAVALVREGFSVSLELDAVLPKEGPTGGPLSSMLPGGRRGGLPPAAPGGGAPPTPPAAAATWSLTARPPGPEPHDTMSFETDTIAVSYHGSATTHLDALSHVYYKGQLFNGFPQSSYTDRGTTKNDVTAFRNGVFTRGVLFDIPKLKGVPYLGDEEPIYAEDLEAWEKKVGFRVEPGDAVLYRTGRWARVREKGPLNVGQTSPGLYVSCAKWFKERDVALLGDDVDQDVMPSRVEGVRQPVHLIMLWCLGTPVIDNADLEALSQACTQRNRWTFLLSINPLRIPGATGGPVNPIAIF
ncbi:MAG: cyclase [Terriglobia bacterium]|nr:MAG: cyclase [Terriglobia bacterium]